MKNKKERKEICIHKLSNCFNEGRNLIIYTNSNLLWGIHVHIIIPCLIIVWDCKFTKLLQLCRFQHPFKQVNKNNLKQLNEHIYLMKMHTNTLLNTCTNISNESVHKHLAKHMNKYIYLMKMYTSIFYIHGQRIYSSNE